MKADLWEEEIDEYDCGTLNVEKLIKFQKELNLVLPASYVNLLSMRNGFTLKKKYFPTNTLNSWANNSVYVDFLFGIGDDTGLIENDYLRKEWGIRSKKLIIISAEPPMFICLDYRRKKNPSVIFLDVDQLQEIELAKDFEGFVNGLVEEIEEKDIDYDSSLSGQQIKDYYTKIDNVTSNGKPKEIDRLFTEILSTNNELIRYIVEKMRDHPHAKVQFYLLLFLSCCADGDNKGILEDDYLLEILNELKDKKNRDVRDMALFSLDNYKRRLSK
ncbi:SMI1/KNR4 family protein [Peribacillus acanthi]|uniref:SMI1/KNR4 family protein n=1 Tax=Peribacillus acanthi TaxID=2171554 RepID=UPI001300A301|nr:SMI1/KNR4 family protein [Peribacillus acanthi]